MQFFLSDGESEIYIFEIENFPSKKRRMFESFRQKFTHKVKPRSRFRYGGEGGRPAANHLSVANLSLYVKIHDRNEMTAGLGKV